MSQTEQGRKQPDTTEHKDPSPEDSFSDDSQDLRQRSRAVSSFLPCQNKEYQIRQEYIPSGFQEHQIGMYTASQDGLGTSEGGFIMEGRPTLVSQDGRHLIFIFNTDNLYFWSVHPFL